ncbi:MAG TPA: FtsX-like permease family protein [Thermoanaerobaculia bacterium]|nr:FtsX-like permease family protein [Thermoanaerobaculia bacterium]
MSRLIAKGLRGGRLRFWICVAGIAVSTMLVLVLFGAYRSVVGGVTRFLGRPGLDLWIAPRGTDNLIRSSGLISTASLDEIRGLRGVARVDPILRAFVTAQAGTCRLTLMGIGFRPPDGLAGPPLISGRAPGRASEIALDQAAAHRLHVAIGDTISLNGSRKTISGITGGTNLLETQFVFGSIPSSEVASFGIVQIAPGAASPEVRQRIRKRFPDLEIIEGKAFVENNIREIGSGFLPMLFLITLLGLASASLLVAFLIEGVVEERRGELAVLLATGATPAAITRGLTLHAATLLAAGIATGTACAHLLSWLIDTFAPVIPLTYSADDLLLVATLLSASGLFASIIPVLRLKDIDPLEAFRS